MERHVEICEKLHKYGAFLTEKQREFMQMHYYDDLSLAEIAENTGVSRQAVHDAIRRGETKLDLWEYRTRVMEAGDGI